MKPVTEQQIGNTIKSLTADELEWLLSDATQEPEVMTAEGMIDEWEETAPEVEGREM